MSEAPPPSDAPYLPPPEPADNPPEPPKKAKSKTILLWILLVFAFFVLYRVFQGPAAHGHRAPSPDPGWSLTSGLLAFGWPLLVIGGLVALVRWQFRGGARFNLAQEPGLVALASGDLAAAERAFAGVVESYRGQVGYAAMARLNLATVVIRKGELRRAAELLVSVERAPGLFYTAEVRLLAAVYLVEVHALRGELDAAARWLADARRRLRRASHRTFAAAMLRRGEALLLTRQERYQEAATLLDRDWRQIEGALNVQAMRPLWLLRALLATQLGGSREQGEASRWLDYLRPPRPGDFAELGEWPQMLLFLATAGLGTAESPGG